MNNTGKTFACIHKSKDGQYYANVHFAKNHKIFAPTEMYTQKHNCISSCKAVGIDDIRDKTGEKNSE